MLELSDCCGLLFLFILLFIHWKLILHNLHNLHNSTGHCPLLNDGVLVYTPVPGEMVFRVFQGYGLF